MTPLFRACTYVEPPKRHVELSCLHVGGVHKASNNQTTKIAVTNVQAGLTQPLIRQHVESRAFVFGSTAHKLFATRQWVYDTVVCISIYI